MNRRLAVLVAALGLAAVACGDGSASSTTASTTTSTSAPSPTATASPTTAGGGGPTMVTSAPVPIGATTTAGSSAPATTTAKATTSMPPAVPTSPDPSVPSSTPAVALTLRANGIGPVLFGADPDTVISAVTGDLGAPTRDSGWTDPLSLGSCPGTKVRTVQWDDLALYFGDESTVLTGRDHFFAYSYGPATGGAPSPPGLTIDGGGTLGTTVADLRAAHPSVQLFPADPTAPASFAISDALTGQLTGTTDADAVTRVQGGIGCGE